MTKTTRKYFEEVLDSMYKDMRNTYMCIGEDEEHEALELMNEYKERCDKVANAKTDTDEVYYIALAFRTMGNFEGKFGL